MSSPRCTVCHGSGKCPDCQGTGQNLHLNDAEPVCRQCGGSGKCAACQGSGAEATQDYGTGLWFSLAILLGMAGVVGNNIPIAILGGIAIVALLFWNARDSGKPPSLL